MCELGLFPAFTATLSSPVLMKLRVIVTFVALIGSMPSVLRARGSRVSIANAPDRESDAAIEYDVEVCRILERHVVQHGVVRLREHDQPRTALALVFDLGDPGPDPTTTTSLPRSFAQPRPSIVPGPMIRRRSPCPTR